jgi:pimeloyl-ACP methyl ester carboxylesterase
MTADPPEDATEGYSLPIQGQAPAALLNGLPHVVCLHGWLGSGQEFTALQQLLAEHHITSVTLPLWGHKGHEAYTRQVLMHGQQIVDDMRAQLNRLTVNANSHADSNPNSTANSSPQAERPLLLVGHSLGAALALGLAAELATTPIPGYQLVGVASLSSPYNEAWTMHRPLGWWRRRSMGHMVKALRYVPDGLRTMENPRLGLRALRTFNNTTQQAEWLFEWVRQRLPYVQVPAYLCHGHYDITVPREAMGYIHQQLVASPQVVVSQLKACGHQILPHSPVASTVMDELLWFIRACTK